jgi:hypothetical protein
MTPTFTGDGVPSFQNFKPFGGWQEPNMKLYVGDASMCDVSVDINYRP